MTTTKEGWQPGIGDPTVMGWVTVGAYLVGAYCCYRAYKGASQDGAGDGSRAPRFLWLGLTVLMSCLAINKQLDLQSLFTQIGRDLARVQGWYAHRREVQSAFIALVGTGAVGSALGLAWLARGPLASARLALLGTCLLLGFIVIRAASFHRVDLLIGETILGVRLNWLFELGGIACIIISARLSASRASRAPGRNPARRAV